MIRDLGVIDTSADELHAAAIARIGKHQALLRRKSVNRLAKGLHSQSRLLGVAKIGVIEQKVRDVPRRICRGVGVWNHASVGSYVNDKKVVWFGLLQPGESGNDVGLGGILVKHREYVIFLKASAFGAPQKVSHGLSVIRCVLEVRDMISVNILITVQITRDADQHRP